MKDNQKDKFLSFKVTPILGELPEQGATDWWTESQWKEHYDYVQKLKKEGKYLSKGDEITVTMRVNNIIDNNAQDPTEYFTNFGMLIPNQKN